MHSCSRYRFPIAALLPLLLLVMVSAAQAQQTTAAVGGLITAADGTTQLPGANVSAVHAPTGTRYTSISRNDGRYYIQGMRVGGPYTLTFQMDGFRVEEVGDVVVGLGETKQIDVRLQLESVSEEILVVDRSTSIINPSRTGAASNVYVEALETLPTVDRSIKDFARTNPFFSVSAENEDPDSISVAGRSGRYNSLSIDGSVNNDLFGLSDGGTPGGQAGTPPISLDAIQELELVLADYDVRNGGFSGGAVNAITRSGTNQLRGSLFVYTRDSDFFGDGPDELGEFGEFTEDQYGFRLGGALRRDKIFFFVNADIEERATPTGWSIDGSSGQAFGFTAEANRFRDILIDRYGFDPGGLAQNSRNNPSDKAFGRLDFNLNTSNQLTVRHNFVDADADINRPGPFTYEFPSETYAFQSQTNSTVAQLNTTIGSSMFNEARVAVQRIRDQRAGRDGVTFPWIEVENVVPGTGREFEAGTEPFSTFNALDQDILELHDDLTLLKGNHTLTFGTHNEFFGFYNLFVQNGFGAYQFSTLDSFEAGIARQYNISFPNEGFGDGSASFDVDQIGLYAGDQWAAGDNLTLNVGLRVDTPYFPDQPGFNGTVQSLYGYDTSDIPDGEMIWQPRFGFNWDHSGNGTAQLRGGAGVFAGRTPYVWISNQYVNNALVLTNLQATGAIPFNPDPFNQPRSIGGAGTQEVNVIDPDFQFPQLARYNLAYDRKLPWWNLTGSVEVVHSDSLEEIDYRDLNRIPTGDLTFAGTPEYTRLSTGFVGAYEISNTSEGEATNAAVKIERPYSEGAWGYVSYAYGDSKVVNEGSSSRAVSNFNFTEQPDPNNGILSTSDFEVEHRFNASVSYRFNRDSGWPTTLSAFYNLQSGRPYSFIMGSDFVAWGFGQSYNGDGTDGNDLLFIPANSSDVVFRGGTAEQFDAFLAMTGLDAYRGRLVPRNSFRSPWNHSLDFHLDQNVPIRGRANVQLTFDLINAVNLIDEDSGVLRFANFNAIDIGEYDGIAADGRPIYQLFGTVTNPADNPIFETHNVRSRWRGKVGVRVNF